MANSFQSSIFFTAVVCLFFVIAIAQSHDEHFVVEGQVYCDTCRAQFLTRLSQYMPGAKVRLECRNPETEHITFTTEGLTDNSGTYHLDVSGDHEDEMCEIKLIQSPNPDCDEVSTASWAIESSKITITTNNGITSTVRRANPLGFKKREALPECAEVFQELEVTPDED